jgi:hypothetical protein
VTPLLLFSITHILHASPHIYHARFATCMHASPRIYHARFLTCMHASPRIYHACFPRIVFLAFSPFLSFLRQITAYNTSLFCPGATVFFADFGREFQGGVRLAVNGGSDGQRVVVRWTRRLVSCQLVITPSFTIQSQYKASEVRSVGPNRDHFSLIRGD